MSYCIVKSKGTSKERKIYYKDKECKVVHREDGPAIEYVDGTKVWYINGKYHREDGPAKEYADGRKEWLVNGKLHREDGPAIEYNGCYMYYLSGHLLSKDKYDLEIIKINNIKKFGAFV